MTVEIHDLDAPKRPHEYKKIRYVKDGGRDISKIGAELDTRTGAIRPVTSEGDFLFRDVEDLSDIEARVLAECLIACANHEY